MEVQKMTQLTVEKALSLIGLPKEKALNLTQPQKNFITKSTQSLIEENGEEWVKRNTRDDSGTSWNWY
jgi:hypothetical protein